MAWQALNGLPGKYHATSRDIHLNEILQCRLQNILPRGPDTAPWIRPGVKRNPKADFDVPASVDGMPGSKSFRCHQHSNDDQLHLWWIFLIFGYKNLTCCQIKQRCKTVVSRKEKLKAKAVPMKAKTHWNLNKPGRPSCLCAQMDASISKMPQFLAWGKISRDNKECSCLYWSSRMDFVS